MILWIWVKSIVSFTFSLTSIGRITKTNRFAGKPLLDIEYNLAQNVVENEDPPSYLDNKICLMAILLWKDHLTNQVSHFLKTRDPLDHIDSKYNFQCWFDKGYTKVLQITATTVKVENFGLVEHRIANIGKEILKFINIFKKLNCCLNNKIFLSLLENLYFTQMRTVDYIKSSTSLIRNTNLINEDKYEIACYFCLEELIEEYFKTTKNTYGTEFIEKETVLLRVFWTFYHHHKLEEFNQEIKKRLKEDETTDEYMLLWAIRNENEVDVHYIWEKWDNDRLREKIVTFVRYSLGFDSINIFCFFISKIRQKRDIDSICVEDGCLILYKLVSDLKWGKYFQNAFECVKQSIVKMTFLKALKTLIMFWMELDIPGESHICILRELLKPFQVYINYDFIFSSDKILNLLLLMGNETVIRNILSVESYDDLKTPDYIDHIVIPMGREVKSENNRKFFRTFIQWLFTGVELQAFKIKFAEVTACEVEEIWF